MWRKLLKYRGIARSLVKVEVNNGQTTSFWHDQWSDLGIAADLVGERGVVDMGIGWQKSVAEAWTVRRRRRHRDDLLMQIENTLHLQWEKRREEPDKQLWKGAKKYITKFSTKDTWNHLRTTSNPVDWHRGVWFSHGTPKFSFCVWLAVHNRLSTGDRMLQWNVGASGQCVLCNNTTETRDHLFFECGYSAAIWTELAKNIFGPRFSTNWQANLDFISENHLRVKGFLLRYVFQAAVHALWRERNGRVHGEDLNSSSRLIIWIDKHIRNQLSMIRLSGDKRYECGLQLWFASRI
ncbi:Reverse transcriptase zinc-binding domain [Arabidopsis suecica]|uniref:Reverse transcriptase zinc-binding domain n=1 Tax=Arabidopsis suecica TaxID=45249 RepID=A0A8T2AIU9_ARASU|nr:Reverse transcriptase zinc-binding domain [Arabidopsis suecica]